ncbi:MAG: hypothetical protein FWF09_06555, partial [Bacteroidales bacterium]|nr:hypothetical protein [Bacteroidales bacterium]
MKLQNTSKYISSVFDEIGRLESISVAQINAIFEKNIVANEICDNYPGLLYAHVQLLGLNVSTPIVLYQKKHNVSTCVTNFVIQQNIFQTPSRYLFQEGDKFFQTPYFVAKFIVDENIKYSLSENEAQECYLEYPHNFDYQIENNSLKHFLSLVDGKIETHNKNQLLRSLFATHYASVYWIKNLNLYDNNRNIQGGSIHMPLKFPNGLLAGTFYIIYQGELSHETIEQTWLFAHFWGTRVGILFYDHAMRIHATKSAVAAIMSRNMSHNLGSHVVTNAKHQIEALERGQGDESVKVQLKGLSALMQYLQERQDFIAVIANDEHYPNGPLNFKSHVFDVLAMDGPSKRHDSTPVNNYILDNIVRSENIVREGSVTARAETGFLNVELQLVKFESSGGVPASDGNNYLNGGRDASATIFKSLGKPEIGDAFSNFTLSVNNGLNGRQALLTIIENFIRNSAKHCKESLQNLEDNTLLFSFIFNEDKNKDTGRAFYTITICDNKRNFAEVRRILDGNGVMKDGRFAPMHILR